MCSPSWYWKLAVMASVAVTRATYPSYAEIVRAEATSQSLATANGLRVDMQSQHFGGHTCR